MQTRHLRYYIILLLKGMSMGAADIVPGVSGGTMAFISGIYEELIESIKSFTPQNFLLFLKGKWGLFFQRVNGTFLCTLGLGIGISGICLAQFIKFALDRYPVWVWSFFLGLILGSALVITKKVNQWHFNTLAGFLIGCGVAFGLTCLTPGNTSNAPWFVFISGAVAICAMILPGISGAFILILLGKYQFILDAVSGFKLMTLIIFFGGCGCGLLGFSHILSWFLARYRDITIAVLSGFMVGALNKVWPWKQTMESVNTSGEIIVQTVNHLPKMTLDLSPDGLGGAMLLALVGFLLIIILEKKANAR